MTLMVHLEDKYGHLLALNGLAKLLGLMRRQSKICDCRPLAINNKVIDMASSIGCKVSLVINVYFNTFHELNNITVFLPFFHVYGFY